MQQTYDQSKVTVIFDNQLRKHMICQKWLSGLARTVLVKSDFGWNLQTKRLTALTASSLPSFHGDFATSMPRFNIAVSTKFRALSHVEPHDIFTLTSKRPLYMGIIVNLPQKMSTQKCPGALALVPLHV